MMKHFKIFGLYVIISTRSLRVRVRQERDGDKVMPALRKCLLDEWSGICPMCGQVRQPKEMRMHHKLPYSRFPKLKYDKDNLILLCKWCHNELHDNPFLLSSIIEEEMNKKKLNIKDYYNISPLIR